MILEKQGFGDTPEVTAGTEDNIRCLAEETIEGEYLKMREQ